jgi:hypothetical protein
MVYAIDLSPRQTARMLALALRHETSVVLEPRAWLGINGLEGRLTGADAEVLRVETSAPPLEDTQLLLSMYCDGAFTLGEERYLFSATVRDAALRGKLCDIELMRPKQIQVCQRRRFLRVKLPASIAVSFRRDNAYPATGVLYNVSGDGLACLLYESHTQGLLVGDRVKVRFALPGCDQPFELPSTVRSLRPAGEPGHCLIGVEFAEPVSSGATGPARDLHRFLMDRHGAHVAAVESAGHIVGRAEP